MIKGMNSMFIAGLALLESVQDQLLQADDFCETLLSFDMIFRNRLLACGSEPQN